MEAKTLFEWVLYIGLAILIFNSLTGFGEFFHKLINNSPTKKDLALKVEQLEQRVKELESSRQ